ncbi:chemotaxis protein CheB [Desulfovibrio subterraneus]|jgi:two-component system chemotaxis response regulator CheB|uniref:protein-glutamate methylesterase n=1 Tax=Desulfovibrio subterraneus TaxID=2718620 RepID=A0A7J0BN42_9BACT|nr:chemotaxis protein CheB [Desulfovibrio subterraneus]WBF66552.1 chemotaxis protein CheB [Desulfovibrio subterraneus]WBF66564.1 chemotaxis protein CheB [Desulfovibrio subterraneus]GFM34681.1 putative chemotaxis protein-glutamate methylesterase [Desulfovibrio subterraneus]
MPQTPKQYEAVVIGVSAGGLAALEAVLSALGDSFSLPILIVQHISPDSESYLPYHFTPRCSLTVKEADDKEDIAPRTVYFAPPDYHMMVELDRTISLSVESRVNFSRPSVDVLFETAAEAYGEGLIGVILTGANNDGAAGLAKIKQLGGLAIVQTPETAQADAMPRAALEATHADHLLDLKDIGKCINLLGSAS